MSGRILVVDDEPNLRKVLAAQLRRDGHEVVTAQGGNEAKELLESKAGDDVLCVFSDLRMPDGDGRELFHWIKSSRPEMPLVFLSAHVTVDFAVDVMRDGAFDVLTKPFDANEVQQVARKASSVGRLARRRVSADPDPSRDAIIGTTAAISAVKGHIRKIAASPTTVLVRGESGTGKELVAEALHNLSDRAGGPLIKVNCSAIPETLFESELFGHEKGAFTGANVRRPGRFELANNGTLFLDEIGDLPAAMQVKLLRVLQEQSFERVGGIETLTVDVRVVAATNSNLEDEVAAGRFREDLFYRLNVVPVDLPPLRERLDDLEALVDHFLGRLSKRLRRPRPELADDALPALLSHDWPGNIRELQNALERAILLTEDGVIRAAELPRSDSSGSMRSMPDIELPEEPMGLKDAVKKTTAAVEEHMIREALDTEDGNVTRAAKRLGISRKGLQLKMKEHNIARSIESGA